jgi:hypothetical protein
MINWFESLPSDGTWPAERERGQMLLVMAMAMVGLLVAAGIAVDVGVLFMRQSQLDRAVDAAALAGVAVLEDGLDGSNTRGMQLLAANGIVLDQASPCDSVDWDVHDYCGEQRTGTIPGALRYHIEVHWESETYFMPLIGFDKIPLTGIATAEYFPLVDIFASDTSDMGLVQSSNQSIFGPDICHNFGDPYTPTSSPWWSELEGVYTYRIIIPTSYPYDKVRVEIFDPDTYNPPNDSYTVYGVDVSTGSGSCNNQKNTCLIDTPWGGGGDNPNPFWFVNVDENRIPPCSDSGPYSRINNTRTLYRLFYYRQSAGGALEEVDLAFYIGKTDYNGQPSPTGQYTPAQAAAEGVATNVQWVSPGASGNDLMPAFDGSDKDCVFAELDALYGKGVPSWPASDLCVGAEPTTITEDCQAYWGSFPGHTNAPTGCSPTTDGDFVVDLITEAPGIYVDPNSGTRQLYLQVRGLSGASENGYDFWAGPTPDDDSNVIVPSGINARQVYIQHARSEGDTPHSSRGVGVYGMGHLPMNSNVDYPVDIPLTYLGPEFAGQVISIEMFDPDAGAQDPVYFFFDSIPTSDWTACYDDYGASAYSRCSTLGFAREGPADVPSQNGKWQSPPYTFTIPSDDAGVPFYGGRLIAHYKPGKNDTYGWKITLSSRPFLVD